MSDEFEELRARAERIKENVAEAELKAGRKSGSVTVLAAAKYAYPEEIAFLRDECGITVFGENRVQTYVDHAEKIPGGTGKIRLDFIGSLQKNKVKYISKDVCLIHSLDSLALAAEIDRQAVKAGRSIKVLVEINSGEEASKGGLAPADAEAFCRSLGDFRSIEFAGFMTMGPRYDNYIDYFNNFYKTSQLALDIWEKTIHNIGDPILSMGMSDSFEPAIAAGSTLIRVGSGLFGRHTPTL
ncbi:MAG: YggS family pyridoxal phosphate-dependent enzyme [Clostridia bacterium]|nr:YggS family pyridoxal phosphate-dependent enzyme [Clostridia bacterium]